MPLLILPSKEVVEDLLFKGKRMMTKKENVLCTLILVTFSYVFALFIPSIGDAMALAGCTTNPMVLIFTKFNVLDWFYHSRHVSLEDPLRKTSIV